MATVYTEITHKHEQCNKIVKNNNEASAARRQIHGDCDTLIIKYWWRGHTRIGGRRRALVPPAKELEGGGMEMEQMVVEGWKLRREQMGAMPHLSPSIYSS